MWFIDKFASLSGMKSKQMLEEEVVTRKEEVERVKVALAKMEEQSIRS